MSEESQLTYNCQMASRDGSHGLCPKGWSWVAGFIVSRISSFSQGRRNDGKGVEIQHSNGGGCRGGLELEEAMTGVVGSSGDGLADPWNILAFVIGLHGHLTCTNNNPLILCLAKCARCCCKARLLELPISLVSGRNGGMVCVLCSGRSR